MAIRDTLTGIGKRAAQGILGSNLRRVAGGFASFTRMFALNGNSPYNRIDY